MQPRRAYWSSIPVAPQLISCKPLMPTVASSQHTKGESMETSIETTVNTPIKEVWAAWITPDDIKKWNFASDDWWRSRSR